MKIAIVGAGIAGLSTYLQLRKRIPDPNIEIRIYESHRPKSSNESSGSKKSSVNTPDAPEAATGTTIGGGLGLMPNGMRVLRSISPALHAAVGAQGYVASRFCFRAARTGWELGGFGTGDGEHRSDGDGEEFCVSSSRQGVWECLLEAVMEIDGEAVVYRKVRGVERVSGAEGVRLKFEDGDEEEVVDMAIGADGVHSRVKTSIFGEEEYMPEYSGIIGVGGFIHHAIPNTPLDSHSMTFTFGANGFFGYAPSAPSQTNTLMWWSNYELASSTTPPTRSNLSPTSIKHQLLTRHSSWPDPTIQAILRQIQREPLDLILPIYTMPRLPTWSDGPIVLIGDAAHALNPTSGQGVSQALEDAEALALLLSHYLSLSKTTTGSKGQGMGTTAGQAASLAGKKLYEVRAARIERIAANARAMTRSKKDHGIVVEMAMYVVLWVVFRLQPLGRLIFGDLQRELNSWDAREEVRKAVAGDDDGLS